MNRATDSYRFSRNVQEKCITVLRVGLTFCY